MKQIIFLLALSVVIMGCQSTEPAGGIGVKADSLAVGSYPQIVALEGLSKVLVAGAPVVSPPTIKPMYVSVPLRSVHKSTLNVQYRFEFSDVQGRPLRSQQGWHFTTLEPQMQAILEAGAMSLSAVSWRLQIRPAR